MTEQEIQERIDKCKNDLALLRKEQRELRAKKLLGRNCIINKIYKFKNFFYMEDTYYGIVKDFYYVSEDRSYIFEFFGFYGVFDVADDEDGFSIYKNWHWDIPEDKIEDFLATFEEIDKDSFREVLTEYYLENVKIMVNRELELL